jgi:toxin ParE1/3/4
MKLRFSPRATQDLIEIANYIRERNPAASLRVRAAILDSLRVLILFPEIGRRQKVQGVRKLVTRKYPYVVYYMVDPDAAEIIILSIQHPARAGPRRRLEHTSVEIRAATLARPYSAALRPASVAPKRRSM